MREIGGDMRKSVRPFLPTEKLQLRGIPKIGIDANQGAVELPGQQAMIGRRANGARGEPGCA
jgi:hypothetical protein